MSTVITLGKWILATLFFIGFAVGSVYFSLPFSVASAGFWPGIISTLFSWIYLWVTSFYYLEAVSAAEPGANVFSISSRFLGKKGAWISSVVFLLVTYANLFYFFYLVGPVLAEFLAHSTGISLSGNALIILLGFFVAVSILLGPTATFIFNALFFIATSIFYYLSLQKGLQVEPLLKSLTQRHWAMLFLAIPSVLNIIYFQPAIPTVAQFLKYRIRLIKWAISIALALTFLSFIAWLWVTLVTAEPQNINSLINLNPNLPFGYEILSKVPVIAQWLPLLLIANCLMSLLTTSLIFSDFLGDMAQVGLKERKGVKRLLLCISVVLPSVILSLTDNPQLLTLSLYITEVGGVYLTGLLPILWIWSLRYVHHEGVKSLVPGEKKMVGLFFLLALLAIYLVFLEIFYQQIF